MLEDLKPPAHKRGREPKPCKVVTTAAELDAADGQALLDAVADTDWIAERLSAALSERGVQIGAMVIRDHRRNMCACRRLTDA